jgi:hypothetical protein
MHKRICTLRSTVLLFILAASPLVAQAAENPFVGGWALTLPGDGMGWLGVDESRGKVNARILWIAGSVMPMDTAKIEKNRLVMTRHHTSESKNAEGKTIKAVTVETIIATVEGDNMKLTSTKPRENGKTDERVEFTGKRNPPVPAAPNLSQVKFGEPIQLFNGHDLEGWRLTQPDAVNGWSVKDGLLVNDTPQPEGQPHKNYGNLRTVRNFEDFNLKLEVRLEKDQNSGVYLRGIYEVQVADTYGKPLDPHNMGAVYSRIKPTASAEKPAGEWQSMDITFVDRHVSVILNGKKIIDNQPVEGPTGGALWADVTRPGPIYLQGDHTGSQYRNIVIRPVEK